MSDEFEPVQINNRAFKGVLQSVAKLLKKDIKKLDKILEKKIEDEHNIPAATSYFAEEVARELFGRHETRIQHDYKLLFEIMTMGSGLENSLRTYCLKILAQKFKYNLKTGECNLDKLTDYFIYATNSWLKTVFADRMHARQMQRLIKVSLDGDARRFVAALLFMIVNIILSGIAVRRLSTKSFKDKVIKTVTKVYYGHSLSSKQFEVLETVGCEGGILFRGVHFDDAKDALAFVNGKINTGTSWSTDWEVAISFAGHGDDWFLKPITSFEQFAEKLRKTKTETTILVDNLSVLIEILKYLRTSKALEVDIGIVLSHLAVHESGIYMGKTVPHVSNIGWGRSEKEVVMSPKTFKLQDCSVDAVITIRLEK